MIGDSVRRVEDPALLRGQGRFAADNSLRAQLHMRVVRSPIAHGRIRSVDRAAALKLEGVVAVWTHQDVSEVPPIGFRLMPMPGQESYRQFILAPDRVRYVGEPIAVVFAESDYIAEDAAELVDLDIEPLPVVLSPEGAPVDWLSAAEATRAAGSEAPLGAMSSECGLIQMSYGDVDAAFAKAKHLVSVNVRVGRHSGVPLECRGAVAHVDPRTGVLIIDGAAKVPFWNRDAIAAMIGVAPQNLHLREGDVGGGFGVRGELYPEDVLVALATLRLDRPIKWIEDRQESLVATNHSRDQRHRLSAAVDSTGLVTALRAEFWTDQGAYLRTHASTVSSLAASMLPGPYRIPSYSVVGHIRLTNKTPSGTYRAPGRYEGTFARERLMDKIADELGLDRIAVRRRNFIPVEEMPYTRPILALGTELIYDSGDYQKLMDKAEKKFKLEALAGQVRDRRANGELVGLGYGWFVEKSGFGPYDGAQINVDSDGMVLLTTGTSSVGQGVDTVLSQIVSETLGVPMESIRTVRGQTDRFSYGRGAFATRQSVVAGSATLMAAEAVRAKALTAAAAELEIDAADLELVDGSVRVIGNPSSSMTLARIAAFLEPTGARSIGLSPGLNGDGWFHTDHMTYPYGVHIALVSIDRGTGNPCLERYFVAYDVGRALNHRLVEGQIVGGVAQGIGGALLEEFSYAEDGQPLATTFMDYLLPTMMEMPPVETLITEDAPSPLNPLGVKGAGEGGVTAAAAAVASAIDDALQMPGVVTNTPIRPDHIRGWLNTPSANQATKE